MNPAAYLLAALGYLVMYGLPHFFFRRDTEGFRFNLRWWLTSLPFATAPLALILAWFGVTPTAVAASSTAGTALDLVAMPILAASIALVAATVATHRVPLALWHQQGDAPASIVTYGPYRWVRHPFYVAFLLLLIGTTLVTRDPIALGSFFLGIAILGWTARGEEQRLLASKFGDEYRVYLARTGRFVPRWSRL